MIRQVIEGSGFVSPQRLGSHTVWTYQQPGVHGRGNPRGTAAPFESFSDLAQHFNRLSESGRDVVLYEQIGPLGAHVSRVGEAARYRNPSIRRKAELWLKRARAEGLPLSDESLRQVADVASITTLMAQVNGSWHVALDLELTP
jgi:hypothetical protein